MSTPGSNEILNWEYQPELLAQRVTSVGSYLDINLDYGARTDDNPEYVGYGARGLADSASTWLIYKLTYDTSPVRPLTIKKKIGVWNDRVSLFS